MPGLTIGWEYLTGCCVAKVAPSNPVVEWPPHPARVFMAMAAAWFETEPSNDAPDRKEWEEEGDSLRWLERLGDGNSRDPQLVLPPECDVSRREVVTVFVPVNGDWAKDTFPEAKTGTLQSAPSIARKKSDRTFPTVWVGDAPCFLHWPHASEESVVRHRAALQRLCGKVTRIGHSSSLVRMWLADELRTPDGADVWVPDDGLADLHVRRVSGGTLDLLDRQFSSGQREYDRLDAEIQSLTTRMASIRGDEKAVIKRQIAEMKRRLKAIDVSPIRPKLGLWTGYSRQQTAPLAPVIRSDFDSDVLILTQVGGSRLPLASALAVAQALRGAVMSNSAVQPPPPWVSGHVEDRQPLRDSRQHLAYVPLGVVSGEFADGHLLGAALVFPNECIAPRQERGRVLGRLLMDADMRAKPFTLTLGPLGEWTLVKRDWSETRHGLKPESWTAHPHGATTWATVTPVVLDRFPKADSLKERAAWEAEVADIIATACGRLGLPGPAEIQFGTTSWHRGSPRASAKRRPLRGQAAPGGTATLGDGFPAYPAKGSNGVRPQLHVFVRFAEPVQFKEDVIQKWVKKAKSLDAVFMEAHQRWRTARKLEPPQEFYPGVRYVLLHSFAHALIRQLAVECGYTTASLRERIYSRNPGEDEPEMAGVLIYTAAPDSEGTLGGLVSLGKPETLERHLDQALDNMRLCASDPLCAEHHPYHEGNTLHAASCHACLFAPETSCERGNKYLDRAVLVSTVERSDLAFFE